MQGRQMAWSGGGFSCKRKGTLLDRATDNIRASSRMFKVAQTSGVPRKPWATSFRMAQTRVSTLTRGVVTGLTDGWRVNDTPKGGRLVRYRKEAR